MWVFAASCSKTRGNIFKAGLVNFPRLVWALQYLTILYPTQRSSPFTTRSPGCSFSAVLSVVYRVLADIIIVDCVCKTVLWKFGPVSLKTMSRWTNFVTVLQMEVKFKEGNDWLWKTPSPWGQMTRLSGAEITWLLLLCMRLHTCSHHWNFHKIIQSVVRRVGRTPISTVQIRLDIWAIWILEMALDLARVRCWLQRNNFLLLDCLWLANHIRHLPVRSFKSAVGVDEVANK